MTTMKPPKDVVHLDEVRAARSDDPRDWTPLSALRKLVEDIEAGDIAPNMVYVAMREELPGGFVRYDFSCAGGGDDIHFVGLLTTHLHQLLDDR